MLRGRLFDAVSEAKLNDDALVDVIGDFVALLGVIGSPRNRAKARGLVDKIRAKALQHFDERWGGPGHQSLLARLSRESEAKPKP